MLARAAAIIPSIAVAVTALVLLGPGATRPAIGARIYGAPAEGSRIFALRLAGVRSLYDVDEATPLDNLEVTALSGGQAIGSWTGATGPDGIAEVRIEAAAPVRGLLSLRVTRAGTPLADGVLPLPEAAPIVVGPGTIAGTTSAADAHAGLGPAPGDLAIRVDATRGVLAAPFADQIRISVRDKEDHGLRADLEIAAPGADLSAEKIATDAAGEAAITVKPLGHQIDLTVIARAPGKSARWVGTIPIVPGATWIAPPKSPSDPLVLISPSPRDRAYLSLFSEDGRVGGAVVPLQRDPQGFHRGEVPAGIAPPSAKVLVASVAGDPLERGAGTVAFPIRPAEGAVAPRPISLLVDGVPAALDREHARAWAARKAGISVVGAAGLLSMLLILLRSRRAQQKLEAHLVAASEEGEGREAALRSAREPHVLHALVVVAVIGLAFAIVAAVSTFR